uniref:Peptidase M12B domain-containing protein n=1 Tax=Rhabditophanes sp. KR3021 TaxID=114890 RepID=A0AC35TTE2_9BILA
MNQARYVKEQTKDYTTHDLLIITKDKSIKLDRILGKLKLNQKFDECHFHFISNITTAAISNCDGEVKGTIIHHHEHFIIHPIHENHQSRVKRSSDGTAMHVIFKRQVAEENDFCGIDTDVTTQELIEDEMGIHEDVFVSGQRLTQESELTMEIGIFADQILWQHYSSKYGGDAYNKLQNFILTMFNNIQIMYHQPSMMPKVNFKIVRYEVLKVQPSALAFHLHSHGEATRYLSYFSRYQRNLNVGSDTNLLLSGLNLFRSGGSNSISGIARLDGCCDPWNSAGIGEGLDFAVSSILTHEIGHTLGMRHDNNFCQDKYIMSSSLGPGKVTFSTCSLRDFHTFLQRLDNRGRNCMRTNSMPEKLRINPDSLPGSLYSADEQCRLMHGPNYRQVTPRIDHIDGICYMMWCGSTSFGRIITSHPALEGTSCGSNKFCQLGRCVPWTGRVTSAPSRTTPKYSQPTKIDGDFSEWSQARCNVCTCPNIQGGIGIAKSTRSCTNPPPQNGGDDCTGSVTMGLVCNKNCGAQPQSVNTFITNRCAEHKRNKKDPELTGTGSQLNRFPQRACKIFCDVRTSNGQRNYRFFGDNLPDGVSCGWDRYCLEGECLPLSCGDSTLMGSDASCPSQKCSFNNKQVDVRGDWSGWSIWSSCTVSCAGGVRQRSRTCSISGRCEGSAQELSSCNRQACPVIRQTEPAWQEWSSWNQCSSSCGRGSQARYRRCTTPQNSIAYTCGGESMDIRGCDEIPCKGRKAESKVGLWNRWGEWNSCSRSCGVGVQLRQRTCSSEPCDGSGQERMSCNIADCDSRNNWTGWSAWSVCSKNCDKGIRTRSRACPNNAYCAGSAMEQGFCNEQACSRQAAGNVQRWSGWSAWGYCSVSCGSGVKRRTRHCQKGNCVGEFRESKACTEDKCSGIQENASWGGETLEDKKEISSKLIGMSIISGGKGGNNDVLGEKEGDTLEKSTTGMTITTRMPTTMPSTTLLSTMLFSTTTVGPTTLRTTPATTTIGTTPSTTTIRSTPTTIQTTRSTTIQTTPISRAQSTTTQAITQSTPPTAVEMSPRTRSTISSTSTTAPTIVVTTPSLETTTTSLASDPSIRIISHPTPERPFLRYTIKIPKPATSFDFVSSSVFTMTRPLSTAFNIGTRRFD